MKKYFLVMLMIFIVPFAVFLGGCGETKYLLAVHPNNSEYGSVTGSGQYVKGTEVTIEAIPKSGYVFVEWSDDVTTNPRKFVVNGDSIFSAVFEPVNQTTYSLTLTSNNTNWGTVSGAGTYVEGQNVTVSVIEKTGYYFTNWSDGNNQPTRQVTMMQNLNLQANFIKADSKIWNEDHYLILINANLEDGSSGYYYSVKPKNKSAFGYFTNKGEFLDDQPYHSIHKNFQQDYIIEAIDSAIGLMMVNHDYIQFYEYDLVEKAPLTSLLSFVQGNPKVGSYAAIYKTGANFQNVCSSMASVSLTGTYLGNDMYTMKVTRDFYYYEFFRLYTIENDSTIYASRYLGYGGIYSYTPFALTVGTSSIYVQPVTE